MGAGWACSIILTMKPILLYGFSHPSKDNISGEIVNELSNKKRDAFVLNYSSTTEGIAACESLYKRVLTGNYKFIVGVGVYSARQFKIKIETVAKNKFRNDTITSDAIEEYPISSFFQDSPLISKFSFSTKMGNSWCNKTSFEIAHLIVTHHLQSQNGFIHIPPFRQQKENIKNQIEIALTSV